MGGAFSITTTSRWPIGRLRTRSHAESAATGIGAFGNCCAREISGESERAMKVTTIGFMSPMLGLIRYRRFCNEDSFAGVTPQLDRGWIGHASLRDRSPLPAVDREWAGQGGEKPAGSSRREAVPLWPHRTPHRR